MFPYRDYGPVIRNVAAELSATIEDMLNSDEPASVSRTGIVQLSLSPRRTTTD
jgi:hypothetical protein